MIQFLEERAALDHRVFEYGAGASTLWWRKHVGLVDTVEHDREWISLLTARLDDTGRLDLRENEDDYVNAIGDGPYDIVVVDGKWRNRCALRAVNALTDEGVIIWDNTDLEEYRPGLDRLREASFRRIDFVGPAPMNHYAHTSSVLYRDGNCLGI